MAEIEALNRETGDAFSPIANHYDAIMEHVDYTRWRLIVQGLAGMLPRPLMHLDAGCGTGVLMEQVAEQGWQSVGIDISPTMLRVARCRRELEHLARADLCALPFRNRFHLVTCLFDSLNFLLEEDQVHRAMASFANVLLPGGLLYFDVVTRRMITDHFNNETWVENHGRFRSSWRSTYDRGERLCETRVRINSGEESITRERIYGEEFLCDALTRAGLTLLAMRDAYTWKKPGRAVTRLDFVAVKEPDRTCVKRFMNAEQAIRQNIR